MGIVRLLIILVIAWLVYSLTRRVLANIKKQQDEQPHIGTMVRCEHCGLHVPADEAIRSGEKNYCSVEHKKLAEHE